MRRFATGSLLLLLFSATANAAWLEAGSDHFVIYGDQNEKAIQGFAERLELFHAAMAHLFGRQEKPPSPSNRVTIFVVPSQGKVREVVAADNRYLAGIYLPRAGAAIAVVPKLKSTSSSYEISGETVLLHEYAHHFMSGLTARTYPRWFVEGFAEFFAGAKFRPDGSIGLGAPPMHRAAELALAREVPIRKLLSFDGGAGDAKSRYDSFYGQSWVLFHYLQFAPERVGQLEKYQQLLATGDTALEAAEGAFGDLDRLEKDMDDYAGRKRLNILVIDRKHLDTGAITVRPLRPGEAEVMPVVMRSKVGVTPEQALKLVPEARRVATKYPDDPAVLAALSEAEFDAGFNDAAIAAADRALAIDPNRINAHIQKGYALFARAQSDGMPPESWKEARLQFVKANKVEHDHPIPLVRFYLSYLEQGEPPTRNAVSGLEWAMQLAPFDPLLRWMVVQQMVRDERLEEAAQTIAPLAYSPHPGEHTDQARQLLRDIEARIEGTPDAGRVEAASASAGTD
jgi:tetratricopeptide (TPR) repeat protein